MAEKIGTTDTPHEHKCFPARGWGNYTLICLLLQYSAKCGSVMEILLQPLGVGIAEYLKLGESYYISVFDRTIRHTLVILVEFPIHPSLVGIRKNFILPFGRTV